MKVSFLIVNYNSGGLLKECISSLYKTEKNIPFEVIIADNNSGDDSVNIIKEIEKGHRNIKTIFFNENVNFSFANNRAFELSAGEYIVIMNPDIIFTEPVLGNLLSLFNEEQNLAAAIPLMVGSNGHFQSSYFRHKPTLMQMLLFQTILAKISYRSDFLRFKYLDIDSAKIKGDIVEVHQIPCAFFMTKKNTYISIGMMDEKFKLYFEDVDLSIRTSEHGKLVIDNRVRITHLGGGSSGSSDNWKMHGIFMTSMFYFFLKHHGKFSSFLAKLISIFDSLLIITIEYVKKLFGKQNEYRIKKHRYLLKII